MDCVKDLPVDVSSKIVSYKIGDPKYLSGETRKVETDRVAVGTFLVRDCLRCFRNVPLGQSWMKPTKPESTRRHKKAQEEHRCGQIAPHGSAERLRCVDARLCLGV